jgi:hypothetical protein
MIPRFLRWLGLHVHEWGPWEEYTYRTYYLSGSNITKEVLGQERCCKTCGFRQVKT